MNIELKEAKQGIRAFWPNYSDERLVWLLAHARSGKLAYFSCCCFIGIATAGHALAGEIQLSDRMTLEDEVQWQHYRDAERMPHAKDAELGFISLGEGGNGERRRRIIPMIKAEIRRRERERSIQEAASASAETRQETSESSLAS